MRCSVPNVVLTVLKLAEEDEALILRGYETAGQETTAEICLDRDGTSWSITWKPHEIKTLRLDTGGVEPIETNMLEEEITAE